MASRPAGKIDSVNDRDPDAATRERRFDTWNDAERIAEHRAMSPADRLRLVIEVSQATLRFATGRRVDEPRDGV